MHKTSMEPWALAEPSGPHIVLEEQLNLLPILDLRQEMPPPRVSKSFLSMSQASPIPSDLSTRNPSSAQAWVRENPAQISFSRTPLLVLLPEPMSDCPASARFPNLPLPSEPQALVLRTTTPSPTPLNPSEPPHFHGSPSLSCFSGLRP